MKLRYTLRAAEELEDILAYIAERSPQGAVHVHRRIQAITELVARRPRAGRPTSEPRLSRLTTAPYPYVIFYELTDDAVVVIGVRHAARDPGSMPG